MEELPDALVAIVERIGGGVSEEVRKRFASIKRIPGQPELLALQALSEYLGHKPNVLLATEIGAGNLIIPYM